MLRPRLRIPRAGALIRQTTPCTRSFHVIPQLDQFKEENAVPGLLSPAGYQTAWTEYMQLVTQRLNYLTAGTDYEQQNALTILKGTARDSSSAALFNYASMAHNNHFFFKQLMNVRHLYESKTGGEPDAAKTGEVTLEPSESRIPPTFKAAIERDFSSVETLRREIYATAMGMFGPGFVWLVRPARLKEMRILVTYLAGSPYTAAHWRRQPIDTNTSVGDRGRMGNYLQRTAAGAGNTFGRFEHQAPGGTDVIPLLCLNTWEHVWLTDYGIQGKSDFIQQWWETIDWNKVEALAAHNTYKPSQLP
ncbi:Manganese/iron superoxide dismutase [Poronia punctata]|nr:Manganese/iron superoxide dismutase [Poronia punctata]